VYAAMFSQNITLPILSFRFKCVNNTCCHPHDVNRFVYFAIQRGIENLNISIPIELCLSLFSFKTLKVLKLEWLRVKDLSHQVYLPLLKTLHLNKVYIRHEHLVKLLLCCPILEDLQIIYLHIYFPKEEKFKALPNLIRAKIFYYRFPITFVRDVESLCVPIVPKCLSSQLKTSCLRGYKGSKVLHTRTFEGIHFLDMNGLCNM